MAIRCCQIDACRLLIVFAKKAAKTADGVTKVSFENLADFLIDEYTKMTKGDIVKCRDAEFLCD